MVIRKDNQKPIKKNIYTRNETIKTNKRKVKPLIITEAKKHKSENIESKNNINLQRFSKTFFGIISAIIIFCLIVWGCISIYNYAIKSEYFKITTIEYIGNNILNKEELDTITKLQLNENILLYEINQIELDLLNNPWINQVKIKRTLPSSIYIEIIEKEPIFWATKNEELFYLDKYLNFITQVTKDNFILLPTIDIKYGTEEAINFLPNVIDKIRSINLPFTLKEISWVSINHAKGYELYIEKLNLNLSIAIQDWEQNIENIADVIKDLENRNEISKIKEIRAAHNQVSVIKN